MRGDKPRAPSPTSPQRRRRSAPARYGRVPPETISGRQSCGGGAKAAQRWKHRPREREEGFWLPHFGSSLRWRSSSGDRRALI
eukprot:2004289-Prymnesium_polylepis.1